MEIVGKLLENVEEVALKPTGELEKVKVEGEDLTMEIPENAQTLDIKDLPLPGL